MSKLLLLIILLHGAGLTYAQSNFILYKKKQKTIATYYEGGYISFQQKDGEWVKGRITKIANDSFHLTEEIVYQSWFRNDTLHYSGFHFSIKDIYAMPKRGVLIDYSKGRFQIVRTGGHQHFYWVKSGLLFRIGGAGYAALNVANGVIEKDFSIANEKGRLGAAAAVYLLGVIMHHTYKLTHRMGKKYRMVYVDMGK